MLDLLGAVALTAGAAIVVLVLAILFGRERAERIRIGAALGAWFALVAAAAATGLLDNRTGLGAPGLGVAVVVPVVILVVLARLSPTLRTTLLRVPLPALIGVNTVRVLGFFFVALYAAGRLPAPFAPSAGWGDVFVGVTAVPLALFAAQRASQARRLVLVWNVIGVADLVTAVGLGVASSTGPLHLITAEPGTDIMTTLPWLLIPGFLVPLLAATHLAVFYRLRSPAVGFNREIEHGFSGRAA